MNVLHVWLAPSHHNPAIHYWYHLWGNIAPRRLCDGAMGAIEATELLGEVCETCRALYVTDLQRGRQAFRLIDLPATEHPSTLLWSNSCVTFTLGDDTSDQNALEIEEMPPGATTMSGFRMFCEAADDQKRAVAKKLRESGGGDPLPRQLINLFRAEHWADGKRLANLKLALSPFLEDLAKKRMPSVRERGQHIAESYIAFVESRPENTIWTPLKRSWVEVGGLFVKVDPEVLMTPDGRQSHAWKLWMKEHGPEDFPLQVLQYLMEQVQEYTAYGLGIVDVMRSRPVDVARLPPDFGQLMEEEAQRLHHFWKELFGDPDRLL